jgi:hypothetical protein
VRIRRSKNIQRARVSIGETMMREILVSSTKIQRTSGVLGAVPRNALLRCETDCHAHTRCMPTGTGRLPSIGTGCRDDLRIVLRHCHEPEHRRVQSMTFAPIFNCEITASLLRRCTFVLTGPSVCDKDCPNVVGLSTHHMGCTRYH